MAYQTPITIKRALERIHYHDYVLPAIQREFVWNADQVCKLFDSLLRGYPIGTFLFWKVSPALSKDFTFYDVIRDYHEIKSKHSPQLSFPEEREITAILDGQQRLTALNIGLCGSYAVKTPHKRVGNPDAYPAKRFYLNLCFVPPEEEIDLDIEYEFAFLTEKEAQQPVGAKAHWYEVADVLDLPEGPELYKYIQNAGLAENERAYFALDALWRAVHQHAVVNFYEEEEQSLSKVLDIFVRVNSGGTVLSKSDLLLSIATAQWKERDARDSIHGLVDDLNSTHFEFSFTKDIVLKSGLVITDVPDTTFKVENFTRANMDTLDAAWDGIDQALRLAAKLLGQFGFSGKTLSANTVLIPIADYLYQRKADESYLNSAATNEDRQRIHGWVIRSLIKPGVWGSGLDTFVKTIRRVMRDHPTHQFPVEPIEAEMAKMGKSLRFSKEDVQDLVETPYKNKRVFALLTLLYPGVDVRNEFHEDHIFPKSRFTATKLRAAGAAESQLEAFQDRCDRLPNLQLLEGPVNVSKLASLPHDWAVGKYPDPNARAGYLASHDMHDLPEEINDFLAFYEARKQRMVERLQVLLGADG